MKAFGVGDEMNQDRFNWQPAFPPAPRRHIVAAPAMDPPACKGDEWTCLPSPDERCPVSHWSRSRINELIDQEKVRGCTINAGSFYALSDVRALVKFLAERN